MPRVVLDPEGREILWVTRALSAALGEGLARNTADAYARSFLRGARFWWAIDVNLQQPTVSDYAVMRRWLRACMNSTSPMPGNRKKPWSASTVQGTEAAFLTIYDVAVRHGLVSMNPVDTFRNRDRWPSGKVYFDSGYDGRRGSSPRQRSVVRVPKRVVKTLDPDASERLRQARKLRDRAVWRLCLDTGPRISEAITLTPRRYFPDEHRAEVLGKGLDGATRTIPVSTSAIEAIGEYLEWMAERGWRPALDDQLFRTLKRPYVPLTYDATWKALRRATGNPDIHPHALRHTAATELLDLLDLSSDRALLTVQYVLGHVSLDTTRKYLARDVVRVIADVVDARNAPRRAHASSLKQVYGPDHLALLEAIRQEAI